MVFDLFSLIKRFEILLNNLFERWGLGQTKCHGSGTIGCGWPSIDDGLDVNAGDDFGNTPLDLAKGETADLLRKHGGKANRVKIR